MKIVSVFFPPLLGHCWSTVPRGTHFCIDEASPVQTEMIISFSGLMDNSPVNEHQEDSLFQNQCRVADQWMVCDLFQQCFLCRQLLPVFFFTGHFISRFQIHGHVNSTGFRHVNQNAKWQILVIHMEECTLFCFHVLETPFIKNAILVKKKIIILTLVILGKKYNFFKAETESDILFLNS